MTHSDRYRPEAVRIASEIRELMDLQGTEPVDRKRILRSQKIAELQRQSAQLFGAVFGWNYSSRTLFSLAALAEYRSPRYQLIGCSYTREFTDHPCFYNYGRRAIGLAAHLYEMPNTSALQAWASSRGLCAIKPDWPSWWNPGWTMIVLYISANYSRIALQCVRNTGPSWVPSGQGWPAASASPSVSTTIRLTS